MSIDTKMFDVLEGMNPTVVTITPDIAKMWLGANYAMNRRIIDDRVSAYVRDMKSGAWTLNSDVICFTEDGKLINGQHRLTACVKANVPFDSIVYLGMPKESLLNIDTQKPRSITAALDVSGTECRTARVNIARCAIRALNSMSNGRPRGLSYTNSEVIAICEKYKAVGAFITNLERRQRAGNRFRKSIVVTAMIIAAANGVDHEALKCFYDVGRDVFSFPAARSFDITVPSKLKNALSDGRYLHYAKANHAEYEYELNNVLKAIYCFVNNIAKLTNDVKKPYEIKAGFLEDAEAYFAKEGY